MACDKGGAELLRDMETLGNITLYNADCMEIMRDMPDKAFDLAIIDPPYGIGASRPSKKPKTVKQKNGNVLRVKSCDYEHKDWDDTTPYDSYFDNLFRVSKNQIIWGGVITMITLWREGG